ncbi:MAG: acetyl-CoA carboxylase, biotin carboxyl carrier protein [Ignavibacteria bacterium GWA2_55_11]|nr:MAG: acetyl-CoA carboxylase, biotin carboxyl carrier protein [Ignavibacteria bacterium GWA2_55_11]OGU46289.1 MAG: acetyl-CoA carboxylase, biotin carboxyl carrier protein [Ignavibacteria bacterium GWC2_56_12]OGU63979.1 MAG: acetyl-CoA carboxylase, biotin carboxyl carrier protein [Ignavibacteria bacterium RIFCSPHIGHO2_02_FULL_56_12]OGU71555.1 MAG: acetyl-CoA carboxylase, biotin carboxyl carrier protein [Ignavibacteria bacterium RIFCSPLOWO2_12_FULL_56_21]OGU72443.1 MAG: acetyl-CoA carboxylase, 
MEISYVKKIIKLLENSGIDEIEIEEEGKKIRVARNKNTIHTLAAAYPQLAAQPGSVAPTESTSPTHRAEKAFHEVRSPIVGTFYRAPSPDADPYVTEGQLVKVGQVLCIVEAMKLMNEIESDADGKVVKIMVENGKPVEYNQVLFLVDKG